MVRALKLGCLLFLVHQIRLAECRNLLETNATVNSWDSISRPHAFSTKISSAFVPAPSHASSIPVPDAALLHSDSPKRTGFWSPSLMSVIRDAWNGEKGEHKPLWPLDWRDVVTFVIAALALFIAAGGGIGGGGVLVPLFILVLGFRTSIAVALSNITIVGGALLNFSFNVQKRHAYFKRPLIDWDLILVMEPATILGALIGGYFNKVSPAYLTTTLLALLLTFLTKNLTEKSFKLWEKENREREATLAAAGTGESAVTPLLSGSHSSSPDQPDSRESEENGSVTENGTAEERALDKKLSIRSQFAEHRQVPPGKFAILVLLFVAVVIGDYLKKYTTCGTLLYWTAVLSIVPVVLLVTLIVRWHLVHDYHAKERAGYVWLEGDVEWSEWNTIVYPLICSLAGVVAGAFGVGGGIVKGPLMLEMGVLPDVAAATSTTMIFFTAASACVVYLSFGGIPYDYAILYFTTGVLATLAGQLSTRWLVAHLNRRSIIIIAMAVLMGFSMVMSYYEAGVLVYSSVRQEWLDECTRMPAAQRAAGINVEIPFL